VPLNVVGGSPEGVTAHGATPVIEEGGFFEFVGGSWWLVDSLAHGALPLPIEGGVLSALAAQGATPVTPKGGCDVGPLGGRLDRGGIFL